MINTIQKNGSWNIISDRINQNFAQIASDILYLKRLGLTTARYFSTDRELKIALPEETRDEGEQAYVGMAYPYAIWRIVGGKWKDTGETGGRESGSYDAQIRNIEQTLGTLDRPATKLQNGYMSIEQVTTLDTINQLCSSLDKIIRNELLPYAKPASPTVDGYMPKESYNALHESAVPGSVSLADMDTLTDPLLYSQKQNNLYNVVYLVKGVMVNVGKLMLISDTTLHVFTQIFFTHSHNWNGPMAEGTHNHHRLFIHFRSYGFQLVNDEQVPFRKWSEWREYNGNFEAMGLTASAGEKNFEVTLSRGLLSALKFSVPVHGGEDGETPAASAAMITPEIFSDIIAVRSRLSLLSSLEKFLPSTFSLEVDIPDEEVIEDVSDFGTLAYNKRTRSFVTVQRPPGGEQVCFRLSSIYPESGSKPKQGRIYLMNDRTFIGVSDGLSEFLRNEIF